MSPASAQPGLTLGVWNLDSSQPASRRAAQRDWLSSAADVWLLTEVHAEAVDGLHCLCGRPVAGMKGLSWSGVASRHSISDPVESGHPTLALARLGIAGGESVLCASSVLPWRGAGRYWPDADLLKYRDRFLAVMATHQRLIESSARDGEAIVWGGDFNQELGEPYLTGFAEGRRAVNEAFGALGLKAVTAEAAGLPEGSPAIDHLAVPSSWECGPVRQALPALRGKPLSDHPSYTATVIPAPA